MARNAEKRHIDICLVRRFGYILLVGTSHVLTKRNEPAHTRKLHGHDRTNSILRSTPPHHHSHNTRQRKTIAKQIPKLHIDLSPYLTHDEGKISLSADMIRPKLQDLLPGSTAVQHITPETIHTDYTILQQKLVPVHVASHITMAKQHQLAGEPQIIPNQV